MSVDQPSGEVGPPYGGSADRGVRGSVGRDAEPAGDALDVVDAERTKVQGVLDELTELFETGQVDVARARWGGVVRELLEYLAALQRVVWPALATATHPGLADQRRVEEGLIGRLQDYDELNPRADAEDIAGAVAAVLDALRGQGDLLAPALAALPPAELAVLGEDLRQVMG